MCVIALGALPAHALRQQQQQPCHPIADHHLAQPQSLRAPALLATRVDARTQTKRAMPVPAAVGFAVAVAANTESGQKVMKQLEELPLLAARTASDTTIRHGSRLPRAVHEWYAHLSASQLRGMILVAASAFTFSLLSTLIKYASESLPSMETVFWRAFVAWLLNLVRAFAMQPIASRTHSCCC